MTGRNNCRRIVMTCQEDDQSVQGPKSPTHSLSSSGFGLKLGEAGILILKCGFLECATVREGDIASNIPGTDLDLSRMGLGR